MLGCIRNADQILVYFDILSNVGKEEKDIKTILIRGTGNEKTKITTVVSVLIDGHNVPP
jgi:archaellum component FlaG (FlaF/FlaG flagellin family)